MKKQIIFFLLNFTLVRYSAAQILCVQCFDQNDSIGVNVGACNMIKNGGFETTDCGFNSNWSTFCPSSSFYTCNITDWTCTGGGSASYPHFYDSTFVFVEQGVRAIYFDNLNSKVRSANNRDTFMLNNSGCVTKDIPEGFPDNVAPSYGGEKGVSLSQTVSELIPGNTYILEFWAGGGFDAASANNKPGLFAVDVGFGNTFLRNKPTPPHLGIGTRFLVAFKANAVSHTIKFTSWGSVCSNCSELILDNVRLYSPQYLPAAISLCPAKVANEFNENSVNISINPLTSQITISFSEEQKNTKIKITNSKGKVVIGMNFSGKQLTLEEGEMKKGFYTVQITNEKKKVIKNKIELP